MSDASASVVSYYLLCHIINNIERSSANVRLQNWARLVLVDAESAVAFRVAQVVIKADKLD